MQDLYDSEVERDESSSSTYRARRKQARPSTASTTMFGLHGSSAPISILYTQQECTPRMQPSCESTSSSFPQEDYQNGSETTDLDGSTIFEYEACLALAQMARDSRQQDQSQSPVSGDCKPLERLPGPLGPAGWDKGPSHMSTATEQTPPLQASLTPQKPKAQKLQPTTEALDNVLTGSPSTPEPTRRPRLRWTALLHTRFVYVVDSLGGPYKASQGDIQKRMNVTGLTVDHVKSHLQKYRARLRVERAPSGALRGPL